MRIGIYFGLLIFLLFLLLLILLLCFLFINFFLRNGSDNDDDRYNNNDSNSNNNDNSNGSGSCGLVVTHIHMAYSQCWCCVYHSSVKLSPTNRPWEDHIRKTIRLCCFTREMINACHVIVYRRHHLLVLVFANMLYFHPEDWGRFSLWWTSSAQRGGSTTTMNFPFLLRFDRNSGARSANDLFSCKVWIQISWVGPAIQAKNLFQIGHHTLSNSNLKTLEQTLGTHPW